MGQEEKKVWRELCRGRVGTVGTWTATSNQVCRKAKTCRRHVASFFTLPPWKPSQQPLCIYTANQSTFFILAFNLSWKLIGNETHQMSAGDFCFLSILFFLWLLLVQDCDMPVWEWIGASSLTKYLPKDGLLLALEAPQTRWVIFRVETNPFVYAFLFVSI